MIDISNADIQQAIRLIKTVCKCPAKDLREREAQRMLRLLAKKWEKKAAGTSDDAMASVVERIYACYPTKCPVSLRSTGKSSKDKDKIARLLKNNSYTEESLIMIIRRYLQDCAASRSYIKNFSTFLNNIPDYSEEPIPEPDQADELPLMYTDPSWQQYLADRNKMYAEQ